MSTDLSYVYGAPSILDEADGVAHLGLATSGGTTAAGGAAHPYFLSAFVEHPGVVADGLLLVARVARTRYYVPPSMVAAILRAADPVVTATNDGVRFESFSACCGVYARLDVDADALDTEYLVPGVTNVDVNPPLREALAGLRPGEPLRLDVGSEALTVTTLDEAVVEEKVALPDRWLKGFAETQVLSAGMTLQHSLDRTEAIRFIQGLPKNSNTRTVMWAAPAVRGLRLGTKPAPHAVCVAGPERLRALEPMLRHATGLTAYGPNADRSSAPLPSVWVLELPGGRISLALSPEKSRGFSGEGAVLPLLASGDVAEDADLVSALLAFEPRIDVAQLAADSALPADRVAGALSVLASSGQVGFDVTTGSYFHRPLPVNPNALGKLHPRLVDAHKLVDAGAVTHQIEDRFTITSGGLDYDVVLTEPIAAARCTCPWYAKHRGTRGPCKHVLAAHLVSEGTP